MAKGIFKEIMIILLLILAVILLLGVVLYDYVPLNKVIPEKIKYTPTEEIKSALLEGQKTNDDKAILTSEVTATDLKNYQNGNEYKAGRKNPFSIANPEQVEETGTTNRENTTSSSTSGNNNSNTKTNSETSNTGETTQNTNYYPDKGTK